MLDATASHQTLVISDWPVFVLLGQRRTRQKLTRLQDCFNAVCFHVCSIYFHFKWCWNWNYFFSSAWTINIRRTDESWWPSTIVSFASWVQFSIHSGPEQRTTHYSIYEVRDRRVQLEWNHGLHRCLLAALCPPVHVCCPGQPRIVHWWYDRRILSSVCLENVNVVAGRVVDLPWRGWPPTLDVERRAEVRVVVVHSNQDLRKSRNINIYCK